MVLADEAWDRYDSCSELSLFGLHDILGYYHIWSDMKQASYRRGRHSVTGLYTHLVFVTKYRRKVFTSEHIEYMREVCQSVAKKMNFRLIHFNGESDYIELRKVTTTTKNLSFAIICLPRCYVNKVKYTIMTLLYNVHKERLHIV